VSDSGFRWGRRRRNGKAPGKPDRVVFPIQKCAIISDRRGYSATRNPNLRGGGWKLPFSLSLSLPPSLSLFRDRVPSAVSCERASRLSDPSPFPLPPPPSPCRALDVVGARPYNNPRPCRRAQRDSSGGGAVALSRGLVRGGGGGGGGGGLLR